ncbi:DUF924 family protein [Roseibium alexandrii]|uniref:DUF924 domain-containing protein n=1 Tax=Roseibium alexandrii TaxID=388408 RepID=A0A0M7A7S7_9HYPH|nr:DUF924 family protein [Roseibium alexandrii]CTQ69783.1 hypothetical protein LAX5112_02247 [Roseibium alexandrii]
MSDGLVSPIDVLDFWWEAGAEKWFARDDGFDARCRDTFLATIKAAQQGGLDEWAETPSGALALILLLDQFTRNVFRGSAEAFAADSKAVAIAEAAVARGYDKAFPKSVRVFFYLPFEHAEDMSLQERAVDLCQPLGNMEFYHYALIHMDVIRRFGRFPHRNDVLGRASTEAEIAFLRAGGFSA